MKATRCSGNLSGEKDSAQKSLLSWLVLSRKVEKVLAKQFLLFFTTQNNFFIFFISENQFIFYFFNRDLNRGYLVYIFSLHILYAQHFFFSGNELGWSGKLGTARLTLRQTCVSFETQLEDDNITHTNINQVGKLKEKR